MALYETQKARVLLANKSEQTNQMIHFLNTHTSEQLASLDIHNRTETILRLKKVLTMRNFVQTVDRKCQEMQTDIEAFRHKFAMLQCKGLPSLVTSSGKLLKQEQYAHRLNTDVQNQITTSSSSSEETVPPSGQSLYDKLESLIFIEHEVAHLFDF